MTRAHGQTLKLVCTNFILVYMINESSVVSPFTVPSVWGCCLHSAPSLSRAGESPQQRRHKVGQNQAMPLFCILFSEWSHFLPINKLPKKSCRAGGLLTICEYWRKKSRQWEEWISREYLRTTFCQGCPMGSLPFQWDDTLLSTGISWKKQEQIHPLHCLLKYVFA